MFFLKVVLFMTFFAKFSPTLVAEQDYYKYYDEYDEDYEYDAAVGKVDKSTDGTRKNIEAIAVNNESTEPPNHATIKQLKLLIPIDSETNKPALNSDEAADDDVTYILTDKPISDKAGYEVTEIVDDIPNTSTFKPTVTNFTIKLPLNNATGINGNSIESSKNDKKGIPRKTSISIFHVNAEFDDNKDKKPVIQNINIHNLPFRIFKVKDHVDKIKDDVFNYVHSTEAYDEPGDGHYFPNILAGPGHFLRKLREKGSALYNKVFLS